MDSLLIFELDRSESMTYTRQQTIDAFNHFLRVMQYREDQCSLLMTQFSTVGGGGKDKEALGEDPRIITHKFVSLFDAAPLDTYTYQPGRGTALYNAIGYTLGDVDKYIEGLPDNEKPTKVTYVIQTDGDDRHSGWLDAPMARALLDAKRNAGWDILFLAAGPDAEHTGRLLGFTDKTMLTYEISSGSTEAFDTAANAVLESLVTGKLEV